MNSEQATLVALSNQLADAVEQAGRSLVAVNARRRFSASGVQWRPGIIVTAEHGIKREEDITVTLPDGRAIAATLVGRDSRTDLAVLRIPEAELPVATLANADQIRVGQLVLAVARSSEAALSTSMGVISSMGGYGRWFGGRGENLIRPDVTFYPGFSGGALISAEGQVLGINTAGPHHMSFTIPVGVVDRVVDQLLQTGRIARGYLGVSMQAVRLPDSTRQALNLSNTGGVIVVSIEPNSPADQAGVMLGDVMIAIAGIPVSDVGEVHDVISTQSVGQPTPVQVVRGGTLVEIAITVGERPDRRC